MVLTDLKTTWNKLIGGSCWKVILLAVVLIAIGVFVYLKFFKTESYEDAVQDEDDIEDYEDIDDIEDIEGLADIEAFENDEDDDEDDDDDEDFSTIGSMDDEDMQNLGKL